jgi:hypothetical protein
MAMLSLAFATLISCVPMAYGNTGFIHPPPFVTSAGFMHNTSWELGSLQHLQWKANSSSYNISIWQQSLDRLGAKPGAVIFSMSAFILFATLSMLSQSSSLSYN